MKRIGFIDGRRVAGWAFPATAVPGNGQVKRIYDPSTGAVFNRGQFIDYRQTGIKTGGGRVDAHGIDMTISASCPYVNTMAHYIAWSGIPTVGEATGGFWYLSNPGAGNNLVNYFGLSLNMDVTNPPSSKSTMMRVYCHGGTIGSVILLGNSGGTPFDNLLEFLAGVPPFISGAIGGVQDSRIRITVAGAYRYIPLHTA